MNSLEQRRQIVINLDVDAATAQYPGHVDKLVALTGLHKARYELTEAPAELRHASREWLEQNGQSRMYGEPWPAHGALPE